MEDQTNEPQDVETTDVEEVEETTPEPTDDINELKNRLQKLEEKSITQRERTRLLKQELEKAKKAAAPKAEAEKKTGELDETQLLFLEVKGGVDTDNPDQMKLVEEWIANGKNVKQLATNRIFQSELKAIKDAAEVKAATPSSTKRAGSQTNDLQAAIARYEQSGYKDLPSDFTLRSAVVDAMVDKQSGNKPAWH